VHLPGGGGPGLAYSFEGVKFASHGFVFVSVTHVANLRDPATNRCALEQDARLLQGTLLAWNRTSGSLLQGAIDEGKIFGGGHSLGGRTWIARTSQEQLCGLEPETRMSRFAVKDATSEALTPAQKQSFFAPIFLNSQFCRNTQIELQQSLGSHPKMLTLMGIPGGTQNHQLFSQTCMMYWANKLAGNPIDRDLLAAGLGQIIINCNNPAFVQLEAFFARQTTKFNIAYTRTVMGDGQYETVLAPGRVRDTDGVFLIPTAIGSGPDAALSYTVGGKIVVTGAEGFCTQPGRDPGENPIVEF
jgi:hypothetical protein